MTATAPSSESTQMAYTPDPRPDPAAAAEAQTTAAGGRRWAILGDHPLLTAIATGIVTLLATGSVALLVLAFAQIHNRIDRLEDTMNARFTAQDAKIDELDRRLTAKIDELDLKLTAQIHALDLKLTALIAALNKTVEVDAAIEGQLLDSGPAVDDPNAEPG